MLEEVWREGITHHKASREEICRAPSLPIAAVNQKRMLKKFQLKKKKEKRKKGKKI